MAIQSIVIKYLKNKAFALSLTVNKTVLSRVFQYPNNILYDVTGQVSIEELSSNIELVRLVNAGILEVLFTAGPNFSGPAPTSILDYTQVITLAELRGLNDVGINTIQLPALSSNVFVLGTAFKLLEVLTGGPNDVAIFVGNIANDHDLMDERQLVSGKTTGQFYTGAMRLTIPYCSGPPAGSVPAYVPQVSLYNQSVLSWANLTSGAVEIHIFYLQVF